MPTRASWARRAASVGLVTVLFATLVAVGFRDWAARAMVRSPNALRAPRPTGPLPDAAREDVRLLVGPPRATLHAWLLDPPEGPTRGTLVLYHGLYDDRRTMLSGARGFARDGWRVIVPDVRGHGTSSGATLTYGAVEGRDAAQLIEQLAASGDLAPPLVVYGRSYGGAIALQLAGRDRRVRAAVSVSTFSSFDSMTREYAEISWPWMAWALPDVALASLAREAAEVGRFALEDTDNAAAAARSEADLLLFHGDRDEVVDFRHAERIRDACPTRCRLERLRGADHRGALADPTVGRRARRFLSTYRSTD